MGAGHGLLGLSAWGAPQTGTQLSSRAQDVQPHTSVPCSEVLRAPALRLCSVLGDSRAPPRPQFPHMYWARMGQLIHKPFQL